MFPSIMAGIVMIVFALIFWDRMQAPPEETPNQD
jgi:hypothetical protein